MPTLYSKCALDMECPKEVVIWNYFDHEHVVGTHFKHYNNVRVIAEKNEWTLCERAYRLPVINLKMSSVGLMWLENPNLIRSIQFGKLGLIMDQNIHLEDRGTDRCTVTSEYGIKLPFFAAPFMPLLSLLWQRITARWFKYTWDEDAPMRLRRWKVWKLGFQDFRGLSYVNEKKARQPSGVRPYPIELPVPKSTSIIREGYPRLFSASTELGYSQGDQSP